MHFDLSTCKVLSQENKVTDINEARRDNSALDYALEYRPLFTGSTK